MLQIDLVDGRLEELYFGLPDDHGSAAGRVLESSGEKPYYPKESRVHGQFKIEFEQNTLLPRCPKKLGKRLREPKLHSPNL